MVLRVSLTEKAHGPHLIPTIAEAPIPTTHPLGGFPTGKLEPSC